MFKRWHFLIHVTVCLIYVTTVNALQLADLFRSERFSGSSMEKNLLNQVIIDHLFDVYKNPFVRIVEDIGVKSSKARINTAQALPSWTFVKRNVLVYDFPKNKAVFPDDTGRGKSVIHFRMPILNASAIMSFPQVNLTTIHCRNDSGLFKMPVTESRSASIVDLTNSCLRSSMCKLLIKLTRARKTSLLVKTLRLRSFAVAYQYTVSNRRHRHHQAVSQARKHVHRRRTIRSALSFQRPDRNKRHSHTDVFIQQACQPRDYHVDFQQIGLDHIIVHPSGFNSRVCSGKCSLTSFDSSQGCNYGLMRHLVSHQTHNNIDMAPRCVPSSFRALRVIHFNNKLGNLAIEYIPDVVVDKCACL